MSNRVPALRQVGRILLFMLLLCTIPQKELVAQQIPVKVQAVIFKKVFLFIKSLKNLSSPKVLIVYTDATAGQKDELIEEFGKLGIATGAVRNGQVTPIIANYNVLYLMPGCASSKNAARTAGILTISGDISLVEHGDCAVSLTDENGKPRIVVSSSALKAEGQEIAAEVLKISRIIND